MANAFSHPMSWPREALGRRGLAWLLFQGCLWKNAAAAQVGECIWDARECCEASALLQVGAQTRVAWAEFGVGLVCLSDPGLKHGRVVGDTGSTSWEGSTLMPSPSPQPLLITMWRMWLSDGFRMGIRLERPSVLGERDATPLASSTGPPCRRGARSRAGG